MHVPAAALSHPRSARELFIAFTLLALQGFGGLVPVVQRELVERRQWLSPDEFIEEWTVAQTMPGPNVCNLALIVGNRFFGLRGAAASLLGLLIAPSLLVLAAASVYSSYAGDARVAGALRGMAAVAAGLVAATGIRMAATLRRHPLPLAVTVPLVVLGVAGLAVLRLPMVSALVVLGGLGCVLTWLKLGP